MSYGSGGCLYKLPPFGRNLAGFNGESGYHHREDLSKREMHRFGMKGLCGGLLTDTCDELGGEEHIGCMFLCEWNDPIKLA